MLRILFCLLALPAITDAQSAEIEKILKRKDVIWAAEIELEYAIEPELWAWPDSLLLDKCKTVGTHLKRVAPADTYERTSIAFADFIEMAKATKTKKHLIHEANKLHKSDSFEGQIELSSWGGDTIVTMDPETFSEIFTVANRKESVHHKQSIRSLAIQQLVFYSNKDHQFHFYTHAWTPLSTASQWWNEDINGLRYQYTSGWLKATDGKRSKDVRNASINWVYRVETDIHTPINFSLLQPLKGSWDQVSLDVLHILQSSKKDCILDMQARPLSDEQIQWLVGRTDTILQFDHTTGAETLITYNYSLKSEMLNNWKLIQDLHWNDKKKELIIEPKSLALVLNQKETALLPHSRNANYHNSFPAFYLPIPYK